MHLSSSFLILIFLIVCLSCSIAFAQKHQYNSQGKYDQNNQKQNNLDNHQNSFLDHADREHIAHDMKDQYYVDLDKEKIPDSEMDFYNFKLHDLDDNFFLDGLELLAAMKHENHDTKEIDENNRGTMSAQNNGQKDIENYAQIIDHVIKEYDKDVDGYISFGEFKRVRASIHT